MKTTPKKLMTLILLGFLISPLALGGKGELKERRGGGHFKKVIEELNLSEEQVKKIKEHRKENKGKLKPLREEAKSLREELQKAFVNGASDGEMNSLNSRLQEVRGKLQEHRYSKMVFFKNILNKEQREKWNEKKKSFKGKFKNHRKK